MIRDKVKEKAEALREKAKLGNERFAKMSHKAEHPIYIVVLAVEAYETHGLLVILIVIHLIVNIGISFYHGDE